MDVAINKSTGKLVNAMEVFNNSSYQTPYDDKWYAPENSIINIDELKKDQNYLEEIKVHYVKESTYVNSLGLEIFRIPCFSLYPNSKAKSIIESPVHKALKEWLFNRIKNDDLEIFISKQNKIKISELKIDWNRYSIESYDDGYKKHRADICLPFLEKDDLLGFGIVFEIQLSLQNKNIYENRTLLRVLNGYSVIWLRKEDFVFNKNSFSLNDNKINHTSFKCFQTILKNYENLFIKNIVNKVQEESRLLDKKIVEIKDYVFSFLSNTNLTNDVMLGWLKEEIESRVNLTLTQNIINEITNLHIARQYPPTCSFCGITMKIKYYYEDKKW